MRNKCEASREVLTPLITAFCWWTTNNKHNNRLDPDLVGRMWALIQGEKKNGKRSSTFSRPKLPVQFCGVQHPNYWFSSVVYNMANFILLLVRLWLIPQEGFSQKLGMCREWVIMQSLVIRHPVLHELANKRLVRLWTRLLRCHSRSVRSAWKWGHSLGYESFMIDSWRWIILRFFLHSPREQMGRKLSLIMSYSISQGMPHQVVVW